MTNEEYEAYFKGKTLEKKAIEDLMEHDPDFALKIKKLEKKILKKWRKRSGVK